MHNSDIPDLSLLGSLDKHGARLREDHIENYEYKSCHMELVLNTEGVVTEVNRLGIFKEGSKHPRARFFLVPEQKTSKARSNDVSPFFLVDNITYLGADKKDKEKLEAFVTLVQECADTTDDAGVKAVVKFLEKCTPGKLPFALPDWAAPGHLILFKYNGTYVAHRKAVVQYWQKECEKTKNSLTKGFCSVHGQIKGIPNLQAPVKVPGTTGGAKPLFSFNQNTFYSHGFTHAPISMDAGKNIQYAVNQVMGSFYPAEGENQFCPKKAAPVPCFKAEKNTTIGFYTNEVTPAVQGKPFSVLLTETINATKPEEVAAAFDSIRKGYEPNSIDDSTTLYTLSLQGNAGRVSVLNFSCTPVAEVHRNLHTHFKRLSLSAGKNPNVTAGFIPLWMIKKALVPNEDLGRFSSALSRTLLDAILHGKPWPRQIMAMALERNRKERYSDNTIRFERRAAILKSMLNYEKEIVTMDLDINNPSIGYQLGRYLAVSHSMQNSAYPNVSITISNKFWTPMTQNPNRALAKIGKLLKAYEAKMQSSSPGLFVNYSKMLGEISSKINQHAPLVSNRLSMEEQAMLSLGFHMQHTTMLVKELRDKYLAECLSTETNKED